MERKSAGGAIRLTNKTAIALRESARTVRRTGVVVGAVLTAGLAAASGLVRHAVGCPPCRCSSARLWQSTR